MAGNNFTEAEFKEFSKKSALFEMKTFKDAYLKSTDAVECSECGNLGYRMEVVYENEFPYTVVYECGCMAERKNKRLLKASGLEIMLKKTFDSYIARDPLQRKVKEIAQKNVYQKDWFFIGGQSGFGKTHICSAIANSLLKLGQQVQYSVWTKDFKELVALQYKNQEKYKWKKRDLETADHLYIDDLFKVKDAENISNADLQLAFEILNYRYNNSLKTIISTELTFEELAKIDQAIAGRIKEKAGDNVLNISKDLRNNYRLNGDLTNEF